MAEARPRIPQTHEFPATRPHNAPSLPTNAHPQGGRSNHAERPLLSFDERYFMVLLQYSRDSAAARHYIS